MQQTLRLGYLYPRLMNLYSDAGNVKCLKHRCEWRGIKLLVEHIEAGQCPDFSRYDMIFIGGGEDRQQSIAAEDLRQTKAASLNAALASGVVCLAICGGFQLLAEYYVIASGARLAGLGHFKAFTMHAGPTGTRRVGNVAARWGNRWLVGFENHGGRTTLTGSRPLAKIVRGAGNNGDDRTEGAVEGNAFGTYLHGSLLPKNPEFADHLLALALDRRGCSAPLTPLDDSVEKRARAALLARMGIRA